MIFTFRFPPIKTHFCVPGSPSGAPKWSHQLWYWSLSHWLGPSRGQGLGCISKTFFVEFRRRNWQLIGDRLDFFHNMHNYLCCMVFRRTDSKYTMNVIKKLYSKNFLSFRVLRHLFNKRRFEGEEFQRHYRDGTTYALLLVRICTYSNSKGENHPQS